MNKEYEEMRETVARKLHTCWQREGVDRADWEVIGENIKQSYYREADQLLSKLTEYGAVLLGKYQIPPERDRANVSTAVFTQKQMIDEGWRKIECYLDGTPVKEVMP